MTKTQIAIHGAAGRMGRRLIALGAADAELQLVAALESAASSHLGKDAGLLAGIAELGLPITGERNFRAQAVIDFSAPEGASEITQMCAERGLPLVMATTGLSPAMRQELVKASEAIPVVWSPSMSLTVNLAMKLCAMAGSALKNNTSGVDVEIVERHHRFKEDAPSGTALKFGEIIAGVMGQQHHQHGREGATGKRLPNEIGYHAVRTGDNPGEHNIIFGLLGETLEITVKASNRDCYALGALAAAKFIAKQQPGMYSMYDVLGL
jgi:4-hydroxy-tetrahydrodipicolinate reductase